MVSSRWGGWLLLCVSIGTHASSYMHSEGELYYRAGLGYSAADQAWDADGNLEDIGCRSERSSFSHQLEYGYSYYYNLFGRLGLSESRCGTKDKQGLGDLVLGIRGRLHPYLNFHSWELEAVVPLQSGGPGEARVGCGALGLSGSVDVSRRVRPWLSAGYGAGLHFWEAPLAHQAKTKAQLGGPFGLDSPFGWFLGLAAEAPLTDRPVDPAATVDDCGTQARGVRASTEIRYRYNPEISVGCGVNAVLWGEDMSRSRGFSCAISHLWE